MMKILVQDHNFVLKKKKTNLNGVFIMNIHFLKILLLSLSIGCISNAQAAALKNPKNPSITPTFSTEKQTPIEKALSQQKRNGNLFNSSNNDPIKVVNTLNQPTQNFLADQNQRFSRLLQSLFQQESS